MSDLPIADDRVIVLHYTLTVDDEIVDSSRGRAPLAYLHGHDNIVPGLEKALDGKVAGDTLTVEIPPEDGYGVRDESKKPVAIKKKDLPKNVPVHVGSGFKAKGSGDNEVVLYITEIRGSRVWVDVHHPMAGKTLNFDVEVIRVREADSNEKAHGHAHGPSGHAH